MARAPSQILFVCESCQRQAKPRHLRRWSGRCHRCEDEGPWTLIVNYTESDIEFSALGVLSSFVLGVGWRTRNTYTNQMTASGISADVAQYLTEKQSLVAPRVVEFIRLREQQNLLKRGAQACKNCDAAYVPSDHKPWSQKGYCSRHCAADDGVNTWLDSDSARRPVQPSQSIEVVCPNGHHFKVMASFSGCLRPCVKCGAKTPVP